jgi:hypothetical protein
MTECVGNAALIARASEKSVLADGAVVGRIMKAVAAPVGSPWIWTLAYGYHEDTPTHVRSDAQGGVREALARGEKNGS